MREERGERDGDRKKEREEREWEGEKERESSRAPSGEIQSRGRECANAIANAEPPQFRSCNGVSRGKRLRASKIL